jgi:cell fate (sporulation/competence/biofilm development) regulator YlbF (YheA/YmcA/DUF963 family)
MSIYKCDQSLFFIFEKLNQKLNSLYVIKIFFAEKEHLLQYLEELNFEVGFQDN